MYSDPDSKGAISQVSESTTNRQDTSASSVPETRLFLKRKVVETSNSSVDEFEYLHTSPKSLASKGGKLGALQARRRNDEVEITPEIAARAVREYLLPMFEAEGRVQTSKARNAVFNRKGLEQLPQLEAVSGTVYGELKLSDELSAQLSEVRITLRDKEQQLRDALQDRESTKSEFVVLQKSLNKALTDLQLMNSQYSIAEKHQQQAELRFSSVNAELSEYKDLYSQCENKKKQLTSLLHEEKAINDKLKNRATELEHGNSLLKMENDIIGERLKGLYDAINHISDRKVLEEKLGSEVEIAARSCYVLTEFDTDVTIRTANALAERDHLREDFTEMSKLRLEAKEAREVLAIQSKEKITSLQDCLTKSSEEIEFLKAELDKAEKLCKGLEDEMGKMRTKMKQNRLKRRQYGEAEEKICRKCQKVFTDADNFNWSCRTHKGEYSDEMWWCCGKTAKDAPGCLTSPHESKDDEEEEGAKAKEETERQKSCKEIGHRPGECPKDPNIRSRKDMVEELKRIQAMKDKKKQETFKGTELQQNMIATMSERNLGAVFGMSAETSSELSSASSRYSKSRSDVGRDTNFFDDVMKIKRNVVFDQTETRIKVENLETLEAHTKDIKRTRPPMPPLSRKMEDTKGKEPKGYESSGAPKDHIDDLGLPPVDRPSRKGTDSINSDYDITKI